MEEIKPSQRCQTSQWVLTTCRNGHKSCESYGKEVDQIFDVMRHIGQCFDVKVTQKMGASFESFAVETRINGALITCGWDIWSGLFIMAFDEQGDSIVEMIHTYLNS